jgi:hypothetical protein
MAETLAGIAYELSLDGLAQQERVLHELRARSGTLLAAASLVASFLGGRTLDRVGLDPLNVAAGTAFLILIAGTMYVLAPKTELEFALGGSSVYPYFELRQIPPEQAQVAISEWIDNVRNGNQEAIDRLVTCFRASYAALLVEACLWSLSLAIH